MATTLNELAQLVGGQVQGSGDTSISGAAILRDALAGEITFANSDKLTKKVGESPAAAVVVPKDFLPEGKNLLIVENVASAFAKIVAHFTPRREVKRTGIHSAAIISPSASLGANVEIHASAVIGDDVTIGDGSTIHAGAVIGDGCRIGQNVTLFPRVVLYESTIVGDRCMIHAGAVLGAYGFGYETVRGQHQLSVQLGYVEIASDVEIGANATIDRGTYGPTYIGQGTKIDNLVMIAHNCRLGKHNLICSQVGIAGSTSTGDYVVMAGQVGVRDHVHIGDRAILGAKAGVMNDVPAGQVAIGIPALPEREEMLLLANMHKLPEMRKQLKGLERAVEKLTQAKEAA